MSAWVKRSVAVVVATALVTAFAPPPALAASPPTELSVSAITVRLQDPYEKAALGLMTHGMLGGRMLPNGELTVRLDAPLVGGDAMNLLVQAFGRDQLARRLGYHPLEGAGQTAWLSGALLAAATRLQEWGDPISPLFARTMIARPITGVEGLALAMMAFGVTPQGTSRWPLNVVNAAIRTGILSRADVPKVQIGTATRGPSFYFFNAAFYSYDLGGGKTTYTQYVSPAHLTVNAYPSQTTQWSVTLTGTVSNSTKLVVQSGAFSNTVTGDGPFSVTVPLAMGANLIELKGTDTQGGSYAQDPPVIIVRVTQ